MERPKFPMNVLEAGSVGRSASPSGCAFELLPAGGLLTGGKLVAAHYSFQMAVQ